MSNLPALALGIGLLALLCLIVSVTAIREHYRKMARLALGPLSDDEIREFDHTNFLRAPDKE